MNTETVEILTGADQKINKLLYQRCFFGFPHKGINQ